MTNTHPTTGIRFGVVSGNSLDPDVLNELFYGAEAVNVSFNEAYAEAKRAFEAEFDDLMEEAKIAAAEVDYHMSDDERERFVERWFEERDITDDKDYYVEMKLDQWNERYECDEPTIEGEYEGVKYTILWLGGAPLVYVAEGPMTYVSSLCSPCCPGAADLDSGFDPHGFLCYSVPQDWIASHIDDLKLFA